LLRFEALSKSLVGGIDTCACSLALEQQLLARLEVVHLAAGRQRGADQGVLILDIDDAELVAVLRIENVLVPLGWLDKAWIEHPDLARIDVTHPIRILHGWEQMGSVLDFAVIDAVDDARIVHLEHVERGEALYIGGPARQPALRQHLRAPRGI